MMKLQNVVLILAIVQYCICTRYYKHLQGEPSEFSSFVLPTPEETADFTSGGSIPIYFTNNQFETSFVVDSDSQFSFCTLSPSSNSYQISLQVVGDTMKPLSQVINEYNGITSSSTISLGSAYPVPTTCYSFDSPKIGNWQVSVTVPSSIPTVHKPNKATSFVKPNGYFIVYNSSPYKLQTYNSHDLLLGQSVTLSASVVDENLKVLRNFSEFSVDQCEALIVEPDGEEKVVPMYDDGLHGDGQANDGIYGGQFQMEEVGGYTLETVISGTLPNNRAFYRTSSNYVEVVQSTLELGTLAIAKLGENNVVDISVPFTGTDGDSYLLYSEIWGLKSGVGMVPIAWVSTISDGSADQFQLELDYNWVVKAGAVPPFLLKNIRAQDGKIQTVLSEASEIPVKWIGDIPRHLYNQKISEITDQMRNGRKPAHLQNTTLSAGNGKIILVHGYCSDGNPFSDSDFTNYAVFVDSKANRDLQTFAQLIIDFAEKQNIEAYSIVAHSQGGLAALHLATYFWSGLDLVSGGKIVQSVGSPYKGTSLAGSLASIGNLFGMGCGSNEGLTKSGAKQWLAGIPAEKQKLVYYSTTEGSKSCSSSANFLGLDKPNDGVTSKDFSQLPNGNNEGHTSGWCHTTEMTSPPQCTDHENNAAMNQAAAR